MKKLSYKIISCVILFVIIIGCNNFLQEKTRSIITPNNYYKNDGEVTSAVNGLYTAFYKDKMWEHHGFYIFLGYGADIITTNRKLAYYDELQNYTLSPGWAMLLKPWENFYELIKNCNKLISHVKNNKSLDEDVRKKSIGQALFIRAMSYYYLTVLWGNVPYYRKDLPISKSKDLGSTNRYKIMRDMVKDLQKAASLLPSKYPQDEKGKATKWAAKTLKAKFDLWLKNWKGALDASVDIINNSDLHLLKNYADVFNFPSNEFNPEIIWEIVFTKNINPQVFTINYRPRIRDEPKNNVDRQALQDSLKSHNEAFNGFGQLIALPYFAKNWPDSDPRKAESITKSLYGYELNYWYFKKFWQLNNQISPRGNSGENVIIFRMADVYLMAAEAENELNGPGDAYQYINKVRKRAGVVPLSGLSQQQFRKAVHRERKYELAGEFKRRIDLIRWGILVKTVKNTKYPLYNPHKHIQPYDTLLPIPTQVLQLNPNLKQNPGF